jgi:replicative DNA helicase
MLKPNHEAEMSVIGSIMMEPAKVMPLAALKLKEEDFKTSELRTVYAICLDLFMSGKTLDRVTIMSKLGSEYNQTIVDAAQLTPAISHASAYIDAVKERSQKIEAYNKAMQFIENIDDESLSIEQCRSGAAEVVSCFNENEQKDAVTAEQGYLDFIDRMEHPKKHIQTGYGQLDRFMYIDKGDFIVIGGRPSAGKTAFTLQMMLHMAQDRRIGYFSLETSPQKVFDRLISNYAWTSFIKIKQAKLDDEDWTNITSKYDTFSKLGFEVIPAAGWTVDKIKSYSEIRQYEIVFVDYLTLIRAQGKDDTERATHISEDLHTFAQRDGVTVIALSQLSRNGANGNADMTCLRQSGQIEQDADGIILIGYDDKTPEVRNIKIAKNKEGLIGDIHASFDGDHQRFMLQDSEHSEGTE